MPNCTKGHEYQCEHAHCTNCNCACGGKNHGKALQESQEENEMKKETLYFISKEEFYDKNKQGQKRLKSPEWDYGVHWRGDKTFPRFRLSWVMDTGEIILVSQDEKYAIIGHSTPKGEEEIEKRMQGWADICGEKNSLDWAINR